MQGLGAKTVLAAAAPARASARRSFVVCGATGCLVPGRHTRNAVTTASLFRGATQLMSSASAAAGTV